MDTAPFFPDKYLSKDDFVGREVPMTIRKVEVEELFCQGGKQKKIVVYYKEALDKATRDGWPQNEKRIVLGKTLWGDYCSIFGGQDTALWTGKRAIHFVGPALAGGKNCIRARMAAPASAPAPDAAATDTATDPTTEPQEKEA